MVPSRPERSVDRFAWLTLVVLATFLVLGVRLAYLQVLSGERFTKLAEAQRSRTSSLLPSRGSLFLTEQGGRRPLLIATTRLAPSAYAVPREVQEPERVAAVIADIVLRYEARMGVRREQLLVDTGQVTKEEAEAREQERAQRPPEEAREASEQHRQELKSDFVRRLGNPNDPYEPLLPGGEQLDAEAIAELQSASLAGIAFREVPARAYPEGTLAAHVLGFVRDVGSGARGEYGVEGALDRVLRGEAGLTSSERDVAGRLISVGESALVPPEHGADVVLTIDRVLQTTAEEIAKNGQEAFKADRAQVVVMNPQTGAILALAAYPTFDPNIPSGIRDVGTYQNPVVADLFEPGSVFKPLIIGSALDAGLIEPDTTMEDRGPLRIGPYTIDTYDGKHHGTITMTEVLEQSNNIGMVWVAQRLGADRLFQFLRRIGIGERTGIPLAGEVSSPLAPPETWEQTRLATTGFGQGIVVTPLQVLVANAALVNGGRLLQPTLVQEIRYPDGRTEETKPKIIRQVIQPETSTKLRAMLASVVEKGVAIRARVSGYYVGGKTGTAQVVDPQTGRYSKDDKIIAFIGFAPADDPAFIALVKLDNPEGLSFAAGTAAPMFHELARRTLEYLRVPPSRPEVADPLHKKL